MGEGDQRSFDAARAAAGLHGADDPVMVACFPVAELDAGAAASAEAGAAFPATSATRRASAAS